MQYRSIRTCVRWTIIYLLAVDCTNSSVSALPVRTKGPESQSASQDVMTTEINHVSQNVNKTTSATASTTTASTITATTATITKTTATAATTTPTTKRTEAVNVKATDINTGIAAKTNDVGIEQTTEGFDGIKSVTADLSSTIAQTQVTNGYRTSMDTSRVPTTTDAGDSRSSTQISIMMEKDETTRTLLLDLYARLSTQNPLEIESSTGGNANNNEQLDQTLSDKTMHATQVTDVIIPAYGQDRDNEQHILGGGDVDNRNHTNVSDENPLPEMENTPEVKALNSRVSRSLRHLLLSTQRPMEESVTEVTDQSNTVSPNSISRSNSLLDIISTTSTMVSPTSLSPRVISPTTSSSMASMAHVPTTSTIGNIDWRLLNRSKDDSDSLAWITSSVFSRLLNLREDDIKVQVLLNLYARLSDHPKVPVSLIEELRTCQNISVVYSALSTLKEIFYSYGQFANMLIGGNDLRLARAKYCGLRKSIRRLIEPSSTGNCAPQSPEDLRQDTIRTVETLATLNLLAARTSYVIQEIIQMHGQCPGV